MSFDQCFDIVVHTEGGLSLDPHDRGNWTGGRPGAGELRGSKWGISAAAYPGRAIASLTLDDAKAIYRRDYWTPINADALPPDLALLVFDSAVNSGVGRATIWLQTALGVETRGGVGPITLAALAKRDPDEVFAEMLALRIVFDAALADWPRNALGWARRMAALPFQARTMTGAPQA